MKTNNLDTENNNINVNTHKLCVLCGENKLRTDFSKNKNYQDGIQPACKICYNKKQNDKKASRSQKEKDEENSRRRDAYAANPEPQLNHAKKYNETHKEQRSEYHAQYRIDNADILSKKSAKLYQENKESRIRASKDDRIKHSEENSKLTNEEIFTRTPIKKCLTCQLNMGSTNFYIDLTRLSGLSNNCKECHKIEMAVNRENK